MIDRTEIEAAALNTAAPEDFQHMIFTQIDKKLERVRPVKYTNPEYSDETDDDESDVNGPNKAELLALLGRIANKKFYEIAINSELLEDKNSERVVYGTFCEETMKFYALCKAYESADLESNCNSCGLIVSNEHFLKLLNPGVVIQGYDYFGTYMNGAWIFYRSDASRSHMAVNEFDMVTRLYSRNAGILESDVMSKKTAVICGCGSVGSEAALALARSGVGHFVLVDMDTLEIHNICRHKLGIRDLGRYKAKAVAEAIHNINPDAEVKTYVCGIEKLTADDLAAAVGGDGLLVATADSRTANAYANDLAKELNIPFVAIGCWQRAHAGETFYWLTGKNMMTYGQAFAGMMSSERPESHNRYFADDKDEKTLNFEPGISADIDFVTIIGIKIALDLLNLGETGYTMRVLNYLKQYTLICNTNEPSIGGPNAGIFPHPLYISTNVSIGTKKEAV